MVGKMIGYMVTESSVQLTIGQPMIAEVHGSPEEALQGIKEAAEKDYDGVMLEELDSSGMGVYGEPIQRYRVLLTSVGTPSIQGRPQRKDHTYVVWWTIIKVHIVGYAVEEG